MICTVDSAEGEVSAAEAPVMKADVRRWSRRLNATLCLFLMYNVM